MKTFIYGRPAPEMGDRGYRIFEHDGLTKAQIDALHLLFSSEDPDTRKLRKSHQEPFCLSMPFQGSWLFGIGRIEVHGTFGKMYHSYLFHGCLIQRETYESLGRNPFLLGDFLLPKDAMREVLPKISVLGKKAQHLAVVKMLRRLSRVEDSSTDLVTSAGFLATLLGHGNCKQAIAYDHVAHWNPDLWGLVLFLMPMRVRERISIITWHPFLKGTSLVMGVFDDQVPQGSQHIDPRQIGPTPARQILASFLQHLDDEEEILRKIEAYQLARDDWAGNQIDDQFQAFVTRLIEAVRRPSINALKLWPPVGMRLFALKADHFRQVWLQHRQDSQQAKKLAPVIWKGLCDDAMRIQKEGCDDFESIREALRKVFDMVQHYLSESDIQETFRNPVTAKLAVQALNIDRFIQQLKDLDGETLLTHLISRKQVGIEEAQWHSEVEKVTTWFLQELMRRSSRDVQDPEIPLLWCRLKALSKHGRTADVFRKVAGAAVMYQNVDAELDPDWLVYQMTGSTPAAEAMLVAWFTHFREIWDKVKLPNKAETIPPRYIYPLCRMALAARNLYHDLDQLREALPGLHEIIDGHFTLGYIFKHGPTQAWPHAALEIEEAR